MRLFLAIELPETMRAELKKRLDALRGRLRGWRWVRPEGIHLTLRFLGEVELERDSRSRTAWRRAAVDTPPLHLEVGSMGVFPSSRQPRVLWVGVRDLSGERLASLATGLEEAARGCGFSPEARPFRAHLTVARAARDGRPEAPQWDALGDLGRFEAGEIVLFQSELLPSGAVYRPLARFPLAGAGERS